eukprot:9492895-Alexandrium_andersonii.AAC.1
MRACRGAALSRSPRSGIPSSRRPPRPTSPSLRRRRLGCRQSTRVSSGSASFAGSSTPGGAALSTNLLSLPGRA